MSVTLEDEDFETIKQALKVADELCTHVISGHRGGQVKALEFARVLNELKKRKIVTNK